MNTTKVETPPDFESGLVEIRSRLTRLERWEWWRWGTVSIISLALTAGLFSLAYPGVRPDSFDAEQLKTTLKGLLAMVILFDGFALYQQFKISSLRRELSNQIGMLCTLEALRPPTPVEVVQQKNRRRCARYYLDKRLQIIVNDGRTSKIIYGRTRDISEGGIGVVISDSLAPESRVAVELPVDFQTSPLRMNAVVCYRRGFSHGFEWIALEPADLAAIRRICSGCKQA